MRMSCFKVLTEMGQFDLAYKVAMQTDFPSWSNMIDVCGGTLGEEFYGGPSLNHHMFSSIGEWFYNAIAGINIDEKKPGFENIIITPHIPEDINCFKAWHQTPYGKLEVMIDRQKIKIIIPHSATAEFKYNNYNKIIKGGEYVFDR